MQSAHSIRLYRDAAGTCQVRAARALTWPTASRMSGVARRMERLTRWAEP